MFIAFYPQLQALNVMHLGNPRSAILSAIIFNALIIVVLIPLALRGSHIARSARPRSCGATCCCMVSAASSCRSSASS